MSLNSLTIPYARLDEDLRSSDAPLLVDVRRRASYLAAEEKARGALRREPGTEANWARALPRSARIVVYCARGGEVSQGVASELTRCGFDARYLTGGFESWRAGGGALEPKPAGASSRWVTRARPKIDRIACPWLIARFVDPDAEFLYVPPGEVQLVAREKGAIPFDVPDVAFSHLDDRCTFDSFLDCYRLRDPSLLELAMIIRGADTGKLKLAAECAGLLAISLGLSRTFTDDHEMLRQGMVLYDALYAWCKDGKAELHSWKPEALRVSMQDAPARGTNR